MMLSSLAFVAMSSKSASLMWQPILEERVTTRTELWHSERTVALVTFRTDQNQREDVIWCKLFMLERLFYFRFFIKLSFL